MRALARVDIALLALLVAGIVNAAVLEDRVRADLTFAFSDVVVFGDSLSDNGNLYELTGGIYPPSPPYYDGRFSNGPVWVEYLAPQVGVNAGAMSNYAIGGATTSIVHEFQVTPFLDEGPAPSDALYVLWAGPNDLFSASSIAPIDALVATAMSNMTQAVSALAAAGAQTFLIPNMPDLAITPRYLNADNPADAVRAHDYTIAFNLALTAALIDWQLALGIDIITLDTFSLMNDIVAEPLAYGFVNVTETALLPDDSVVDNPDLYLFWDELHPTTAAHMLFAEVALAAIPAPGAAAGLLLIWLIGPRLDRRQRRA